MRTLLRRLLLLVVLGTAGWFLTRWAVGSSWGREVLERRIGHALEMDVAVATSRLEWPGFVVAEDVKAWFSSDRAAEPGVEVKELRASLCGQRLELRRPVLRLTQGVAGDWQPSAFRGLAKGMEASQPLEGVLDRVVRVFGSRRSFDLVQATVVCRPTEGAEVPVFGGLSWQARPVSGFEGHGRVHRHVATLQTRCGRVVGADGLLTVEWLSARGREPLRLWWTEGTGGRVPPPDVGRAEGPYAVGPDAGPPVGDCPPPDMGAGPPCDGPDAAPPGVAPAPAVPPKGDAPPPGDAPPMLPETPEAEGGL